jgi:hypothetical protein
MASIWTGLLFMHGHITDLDLVRSLDRDKPRDTQAARPMTGKSNPKPKAGTSDTCDCGLRPAC